MFIWFQCRLFGSIPWKQCSHSSSIWCTLIFSVSAIHRFAIYPHHLTSSPPVFFPSHLSLVNPCHRQRPPSKQQELEQPCSLITSFIILYGNSKAMLLTRPPLHTTPSSLPHCAEPPFSFNSPYCLYSNQWENQTHAFTSSPTRTCKPSPSFFHVHISLPPWSSIICSWPCNNDYRLLLAIASSSPIIYVSLLLFLTCCFHSAC